MRGLQGLTWAAPVSDTEAGALLRAFPNYRPASLTDSDLATEQTVQFMRDLVQHSLADPIIAEAWADAWRMFAGITGGDEPSCCWWYAKTLIKFVHHQELFVRWLGKFDELQLLISPEALLKMRRPEGDCAIFTCLIQAMLAYRGFAWGTVTVAVNPRLPDLYTHVYAVAQVGPDTWLPLDASHGTYPGWSVPPQRVLKKKCSTPTQMRFIPVGVN